MSKSSDSSDLMERAKAGDRDALIEYMFKHFDSRVRRRVAGKLRQAGITILDVEDVYDSAGRRMLLRCEKTGLVFSEPGNLDAYITQTVMNIAKEKIRAERSRRRTLDRFRRSAALQSNGAPGAPEESVIDSLLSRLKDNVRRMLEMRLLGLAHVQIAVALALPLRAYREMWRGVRMQATRPLAVA